MTPVWIAKEYSLAPGVACVRVALAFQDEKSKLAEMKPDLSDEAHVSVVEPRHMVLALCLILTFQMAKFRLPLSAVEETAMEARTV